jgi:hypothetical protein
MQRWLCLVLAGLGVCLLLALGHSEARRSGDSHPCLAGWVLGVGPWGELTPAPPTADPAAPTAMPPQAHAAPSGSGAVHLVLLTERDVGPICLDSRGPPGKVRETLVDFRAAGQTDSPKQGVPSLPQQGSSTPKQARPQKGVLQQPLASARRSCM